MKKVLVFILLLLACISLSACAPKGPAPYQIIDNDTGKTYSIGDPRDKFEIAFGEGEYNTSIQATEYLGGMLRVKYVVDKVTEIYVSAETNRFSFYNFDFSMDEKDIRGRYDESGSDIGYKHFSRYYDKNGKVLTDTGKAFFSNTDYYWIDIMMKDGEYLGCYLHEGWHVNNSN